MNLTGLDIILLIIKLIKIIKLFQYGKTLLITGISSPKKLATENMVKNNRYNKKGRD